MMKSMGICNEIIKNIVYDIIEKMYEKTRCAVAVDEHLTEWFLVSEDARQSFLTSPTLFNLFLDFVENELKCLQQNVTLDYELNSGAKCADDTILFAAVFEKLQLATDQL